MKKHIISKCKKIKLVITDVDGVLTDGGMYYSKTGEELKKFNTRDGMAVELLLQKKIKTVIMTKENSLIVKKRAKKIKVDHAYVNIGKKELQLTKVCTRYNVSPEEIAYVGDDVNDFEIMKLVGFSATPNDGVSEIKKIADYICTLNGGKGVLREVADMILSVKSK